MESDKKMKQTLVQKFRDTATTEQWAELVEVAKATSPIGASVKERYGFTWSAVLNDVVSRGLYSKRERPTTLPPEEHEEAEVKQPTVRVFHVDDVAASSDYTTRSVQIDNSVLERLYRLENCKAQYTKRSILNQLLSDALNLYGF